MSNQKSPDNNVPTIGITEVKPTTKKKEDIVSTNDTIEVDIINPQKQRKEPIDQKVIKNMNNINNINNFKNKESNFHKDKNNKTINLTKTKGIIVPKLPLNTIEKQAKPSKHESTARF